MHVEGCKHVLEITVPVEEIKRETDRVVANLALKVNLPGFRPGKVPTSVVRNRFPQEIRQEVLDAILPKAFRRQAEEQQLAVVGTPNVTEIKWDEGQPLWFKAEFEVAPDVPLDVYKGLEAPYEEPQVADEEINTRIEALRDQKADYVNVDPRPLADGDFAAVALQSLEGANPPVDEKDLQIEVGGETTMPAFNEALRGMQPGESKEVEVTYPEDYGSETLAGKTVKFRVALNTVRVKELPEVDDEFAKDLGDFQNLDELREAIRKQIFAERDQEARMQAHEGIVDKLVDAHDFAIPEAYVDRQIEINVERQLRQLAGQGIDPRQLKLDWNKIKEAQRPKAHREVKASLLLERVADTENIQTTDEELDAEVQAMARRRREPVAATRMMLEKDGSLQNLSSQIRTYKTLSYLFDQARKVKPEPKPVAEPAAEAAETALLDAGEQAAG